MGLRNNQLDESQQKAVTEIDHHLYVTASAGTGKTEVLTRRFMYILEQKKVNVSSILAITFTEKAALEMKSRIFRSIQEKMASESNSRELSYWKGVKNDFRHAKISTIHSFCSGLIREHATELSIDPEYGIIEENELRFELHKYLKEKILAWLEEKDSSEASKGQTARLLLKSFKFRDLKDLLITIFFNHYEWTHHIIPLYEQMGTKDQWVAQVKDLIDKELKQQLDKLKSLAPIQKLQNYLEGLDIDSQKACSFTDHVISVKDILKSLLEGKIHADIHRLYDKKKPGKKDIANWTTDGISRFHTHLSPLIWHLPEVLFQNIDNVEDQNYTLVKALIDLFKELNHSILSMSPSSILYQWLNHSLLTYDDLQTLALELLSPKDDSSQATSNSVLQNIQDKYQYIMVDESQDIDRVQKEIISSLSDLSEHSPNLFIVGDSKQSIYKFRGANINEFQDLTESIQSIHNENHDLDTNYRSQEGLVHFVNSLFIPLMAERNEGFEATYKDPVNAHRKEHLASVEVLLHDGATEDEAQSIAHRILSLLQNPVNDTPNRSYGDITILLQTLTHVTIYEKALSDHEIPYQTLSNKGFYKLREIIDCLNLLKALNDPGDYLALCGLLRSPFCSVSDQTLFWLVYNDENPSRSFSKGFYQYLDNPFLSTKEKDKLKSFNSWFNQLSNLKDRLDIHVLITKALEASGYLSVILSDRHGPRRKETIDLFLLKIKKLEKQKSWTLSEFLEYIHMLQEYDTHEDTGSLRVNKDQVSIMSIHKAKGCEFPIVILPYMERKPKGIYSNILFDRDFGIGLKVYSFEDRSYQPDALYNYLKHRDMQKEASERIRLFYVATTRAKDYLILSGKAPSKIENSNYVLKASFFDHLFHVLGPEVLTLIDEIKKSQDHSSAQLEHKNSSILFWWNYSFDHSNPEQESFDHKSFQPEKSSQLLDHSIKKDFDRLTASSVLVYSKCPRRFYYKYILQIVESQEALGPYKKANKQLQTQLGEDIKQWPGDIPLNLVGNLVHKILEKFKHPHHSLSQIILAHLNTQKLTTLASSNAREKIQFRIQALIESFIASELFREIQWSEAQHPDDQYNELSFIYRLDDTLLEGSIDKVYRNEADEWVLLDYKTNRFRNKKAYHKELESKRQEYELQMRLYALVTSRILGQIEKNVLYFFDIEEAAFIPSQSDTMDLDTRDILSNTIKGIKKQLDSKQSPEAFVTKPSSKDCQFCGYWMCESRIQ